MLTCWVCGMPSVVLPAQHQAECPLHDPATCQQCAQGGPEELTDEQLDNLYAMIEKEDALDWWARQMRADSA